MRRPACPSCEGAGYHSSIVRTVIKFTFGDQEVYGVREVTIRGKGVFPKKRRYCTIKTTCPYCGGEGRVHPDTLDAYIKNVRIEEDGQ